MTKISSWQNTFDSGVITTPSHQAPDTNDAITTTTTTTTTITTTTTTT